LAHGHAARLLDVESGHITTPGEILVSGDSITEVGAKVTHPWLRQLDLAPFDRFIWPHLLVNLLSAPGRSEALRRPEGDAFRA
jgi:hypothetical protein